ncbi:MAG TPA: ribose-5-phosphate isomerase A, partial [Pelobium sp.]|nr:ribose-5-phosphate isomerase A [Pelobium sp.]
ADAAKGSDYLGSFAVPVEVTPFGKEITIAQLKALQCEPKLRYKDDELVITDNQNYIVDCKFEKIENPAKLSQQINAIPGVVENGLFPDMANVIISEDGKGSTLKID